MAHGGVITEGPPSFEEGDKLSTITLLLGVLSHSLQVKGRIGGQHIVALIDGVATHDSIDQGVVE